MKTWLRLLLVTLTVGGGFTGAAAMLEAMRNARGFPQLLVLIVFLGLYGFVVVSGLILVWNPARTRPVLAALALQVPWLSSTVLTYNFASGMCLEIALGPPQETGRFGLYAAWYMHFGAYFRFHVGGSGDDPLAFGVNVIALVLFILVLRSNRLSHKASQQTVAASAVDNAPIHLAP
ncbi:MAG TPA: hypothetical protein VMD29_01510 [Terracidiphilus sp.]|nr:hypothetical protein [Terracidiphilus sp.]